MVVDAKSKAQPLDYMEKDVFVTSGLLINLIRDKHKKIVQLEMNVGRAKHLMFDKMPQPKAKSKPVARTNHEDKPAPLKAVGS
jgi:hypothetical protein